MLVPYDTAADFTMCLLGGLHHLHEKGFYHLNVSLETMLAFQNDTRYHFRLSFLDGVTSRTSVSTLHSDQALLYVPPELLAAAQDHGE
eukprot:6203710-Pleurochrysis_carterae.AAC.1